MLSLEQRTSITDNYISRIGIPTLPDLRLSPESFVAGILLQEGRPFCHQGNLPQQGFDCCGLLKWGLLRPQGDRWIPNDPVRHLTTDYPRLPVDGTIDRIIQDEFDVIKIEDIKIGDLLSLRWKGDTHERHMAAIVDVRGQDISICHAHRGTRMVSVHDLTDEWLDRVIRTIRLRHPNF